MRHVLTLRDADRRRGYQQLLFQHVSLCLDDFICIYTLNTNVKWSLPAFQWDHTSCLGIEGLRSGGYYMITLFNILSVYCFLETCAGTSSVNEI